MDIDGPGGKVTTQTSASGKCFSRDEVPSVLNPEQGVLTGEERGGPVTFWSRDTLGPLWAKEWKF